MKRVETISINGIVFSITDEAYRKLNDYLNPLYQYFEHKTGGNEIITDIEARIAELFAGRAGGVSQAITYKDVIYVIETLGSLEDITDSDNDGDNNPPYSSQKKYTKRLYRNPDQSILGGVCAGIALYLEINVIIVRLVFIACFLFYGISILAYFLLWIIIPLAKTTAQKLEMQGQPINISNIERSIRGNMSSGSETSSEQYVNESSRAEKMPKIIWQIIRVTAGIILCAIGISIALSFCALLVFHEIIFEWHIFPFSKFLPHVVSSSSYTIISVSTIVFMVLTIAACIYWGIKAITGSKVKYPQIHIALLIIWFLIIPVATTTVFRELGGFFEYNQTVNVVNINTCDTMYLNLQPSALGVPDNLSGAYYDDENNCFYGKPNVYIRKSDGKKSKLQIVKKSRGRNKHTAFMHAKNIEYNFDIKDSLITFSPYFTIAPPNDWKYQHLEVILSVPEKTVIIVDESLCYTNIIVNPRQSEHDDNVCKWIMTKKGLKAINN